MSKPKSKTKPKTASKNIPNKVPKKVAKTIVKKTKKPKVVKTAKTSVAEDAATKQALYIEKTDDVYGLEITNNIEHVATEPALEPTTAITAEPTQQKIDDHDIVAANTTHIDDYKSYDVPTTCGQHKDNTVLFLCVSFAIGMILWMMVI